MSPEWTDVFAVKKGNTKDVFLENYQNVGAFDHT